MRVILLYLTLIALFGGVLLLNSCKKQTTCHGCIRDASVCAWCAMENFNGTRCMSLDADLTMCKDYIENPKKDIIPVKNLDFNSTAGSVRQIKPQQYKLKLRAGQPSDFSFSFAAVKDYPVDVYFILDASHTMNSTRDSAVAQSKKIYETLHSATKDVFLGMGTFIDKNALPYNINVSSHKVYSFKNDLKLNPDYTKFQEVMKNTEFISNRDIPEGGLDALAQAMVCKKEIGWRKESRKIIILLTDGPYHAAGDGRSGGIFQPYDGKCYTVDGRYTNELKMDYPSVAMINKLAKENEIIVIFAVDKSDTVYTILADNISGAHKHVLHNDEKDNIVKILKDIYEKITKNIKLKVHKRSVHRNNFKLSFDPDCTIEGNDACKVSVGKVSNFAANITLEEYIGSDSATIDIGIEGISEKLVLDIEIINDCGCENAPITKSKLYCDGEKIQCGICQCTEPKYGDNCKCTRNKDNKAMNTNGTCIMEGDEVECSGQGKCSCGKCECSKGRLGKYCECDEYTCRRDNDAICSNHGECQCDGSCKCDGGWTGPSCECPVSIDSCLDNNGKVCNNRGTCGCGGCLCENPADWDSRKENDQFCFVNPCPGCHESQCELLTNCVACTLNGHDKCCPFTINNTIIIEVVDTLDINDTDVSNEKQWNKCFNTRVDIGCNANFMYMYDDNNYRIHLKIQKGKNCLESYLMYGGLILLTLIVVGVVTLVAWKLLTDARDRREYQLFVKNQNVADICQNPLYEPASTTFTNPAFRRRPSKN